MEVNPPGASGWFLADFAALTIPPAYTEGVVGLVCSAPPMFCVPCSSGVSCDASTVITTCAAGLRGCHVALQRPSFNDVSGSVGSLSENDAVTLPLVMRFPQSSTMVTSIGVGQAATVAKLAPSCVNKGISFLAMQEEAVTLSDVRLPDPEITINSTAMLRDELSGAKCSWMLPKYTPAASPV